MCNVMLDVDWTDQSLVEAVSTEARFRCQRLFLIPSIPYTYLSLADFPTLSVMAMEPSGQSNICISRHRLCSEQLANPRAALLLQDTGRPSNNAISIGNIESGTWTTVDLIAIPLLASNGGWHSLGTVSIEYSISKSMPSSIPLPRNTS
jgi:hypothetical protein